MDDCSSRKPLCRARKADPGQCTCYPCNPCPWCGGFADWGYCGGRAFVSCKAGCCASGPISESPSKAVAMWNRVAEPTPDDSTHTADGRESGE